MAFRRFPPLLLPLGVAALLAAGLLSRLPSEANPAGLNTAASPAPGSAAATIPGPPELSSPPPAAPAAGTGSSGSGSATPAVAPAAPGAGAPAAAGLPLLPSRPGLATTADGRHYPLIPADPAGTATLLAELEQAVRSPATPESALPALAHQQQVIYRVLSHQDARAAQVRSALPERWQGVFDLHIQARRAFNAMHDPARRPSKLPAWRIQAPRPAEDLLVYYREASAATGIPWQVLAAVNLVESGMGRIDGVSVADAHGPMQFLPGTWAEPGIGNGGDIRDPRTAINAAARYLVRRGGLRDIRKGLWGYNNSDLYGTGVLAYAELLRRDPSAYRGLYHWEIHYASAAGDIWLPVGYEESAAVPVAAWLSANPAGAPPPGSSGY